MGASVDGFSSACAFSARKEGLEIRLRGYEYDDWGELC